MCTLPYITFTEYDGVGWLSQGRRTPGRWVRTAANEYVCPVHYLALRSRKDNGLEIVGVLIITLDSTELLC